MIDWNDNAELAVREFADWARSMVKCGNAVDVDFFLKEFTDKAQTKTVKDAVEFHNGVWPKDEPKDFICIWNSRTGEFVFWCSDYEPVDYCYEACTYEQFEAYVKEQEGEKWTHTHGGGAKCIVVAEHNKYSWLLTEGGGMVTEYTESLKPIKPTISESEAWRKAVLAGNMQHITDNYNVVAKD